MHTLRRKRTPRKPPIERICNLGVSESAYVPVAAITTYAQKAYIRRSALVIRANRMPGTYPDVKLLMITRKGPGEADFTLENPTDIQKVLIAETTRAVESRDYVVSDFEATR